MSRLRNFLILPLFVFLQSGTTYAAAESKPVEIPAQLGKQVVNHYIKIVRAAYAEALKDAKLLRQAVEKLTTDPSQKKLEQAREAWKQARLSYGPTEAFRFYGGPIDHPEDGPEGLINAWPLDEAYIDYVDGQKDAGIINQVESYPKITRAVLVDANEQAGEKNISTGYHAIEFLLWGQDKSLKGPGDRKFSDYQSKKKGDAASRRGTYLITLADLLVENLEFVAGRWEEKAPKSFAVEFRNEPLEESLRKIYTGVIGISIDEMAGERMIVALELNDQENEQSCFSDFTLMDANADQEGVRAVYYGAFKDLKGPGLRDLAKAVDQKLLNQSDKRVEESTKRLKELSKSSFDQIIVDEKHPDRKKVLATISALEEQARTIAAVGEKMGLVLNIQ